MAQTHTIQGTNQTTHAHFNFIFFQVWLCLQQSADWGTWSENYLLQPSETCEPSWTHHKKGKENSNNSYTCESINNLKRSTHARTHARTNARARARTHARTPPPTHTHKQHLKQTQQEQNSSLVPQTGYRRNRDQILIRVTNTHTHLSLIHISEPTRRA